MLQFGRKKASFSIFERICDSLSTRADLKNSPMINNLLQKREICDRLRSIETKLKASEPISYSLLVTTLDQFSSKCNEVDLKLTEDYLILVTKKAEPILSSIAPTMLSIAQASKKSKPKTVTLEELSKQVLTLKSLPFIFEETNEAISLLKKCESLEARSAIPENTNSLPCLDLFKCEYNNLGVRIGTLENLFKRSETEKDLIESLQKNIDDICGNFGKGYKVLVRLWECRF